MIALWWCCARLVAELPPVISCPPATPFRPRKQRAQPRQFPRSTSTTGTPADLEGLFRPFWEAWDIVHGQYVDQPVDDTLLMQGAIRGMLKSLGDPHSLYMDPQVTEDENAILSGEYDGIGAWVDTGEEFLTIISPMTDSPAEKAGLLPGDQIVAVDGQDMAGTDPAAGPAEGSWARKAPWLS